MVSVRTNGTSSGTTATVQNLESSNHRNTKKYRKKRRPRRRPRNTVVVYKYMALIVFAMLYIWAKYHWSWKRQALQQAQLKRAYSLQRLRKNGNLDKQELNQRGHEKNQPDMQVPKHAHEHEKLNVKVPQHVPESNNLDGESKQKEQLHTAANQHDAKYTREEIQLQLSQLDQDMLENRHGGIRFISPKWLPSLPGKFTNSFMELDLKEKSRQRGFLQGISDRDKQHYHAQRHSTKFAWEKTAIPKQSKPIMDYTLQQHYQYATPLQEVPPAGSYPPLKPLGEIMQHWPQDELNHPPVPLVEDLQRFDYQNLSEMRIAKHFRNAELPFKIYNVPELTTATQKWTDEYLSHQFDDVHVRKGKTFGINLFASKEEEPPVSRGTCQESHNNFFAFFIPPQWDVDTMGLPPTRNNDFTYKRWASHARHADAVGLEYDRPHFYWQSGVPREERFLPKTDWTFVSRDLPSWSSPTETFFVFEPSSQKGIQCRFGERGVTAATHYDAGRNMVAMITGAKRYILSPPNQCSKLGIVNTRGQPTFRHSLLNFAHFSHLHNSTTMSLEEKSWLERAQTSLAVDTVVKEGEVLYIPSHWFHYITSLQKSAQCNVRSGRDSVGTPEFGGFDDVDKCVD